MRPWIRKFVTAASCAAVIALLGTGFMLPGRAADMPPGHPPAMDHMMPGQDQTNMSPADSRELVRFPSMMRTHMLGNMRDHVETLNAILQAIATGDYDGAANIAAERLGLDSPSAVGCKPKAANAPPPPKDSMDAMMALYMPEAMRATGLAMHTAASEFATVARTHDPKATAEALARITPNCVACHSAYRLQ